MNCDPVDLHRPRIEALVQQAEELLSEMRNSNDNEKKRELYQKVREVKKEIDRLKFLSARQFNARKRTHAYVRQPTMMDHAQAYGVQRANYIFWNNVWHP